MRTKKQYYANLYNVKMVVTPLDKNVISKLKHSKCSVRRKKQSEAMGMESLSETNAIVRWLGAT